MFELDDLLELNPFNMERIEKRKYFESFINKLTHFHYNYCKEYHDILNALKYSPSSEYSLENFPYIPVRLFKELSLKSIQTEQVFKVLKSSGTSGQRTSQIIIDKNVSEKQIKVLSKLTSNFIGPKRLPMLIIDSNDVLRNPKSFSARGAGILGFSMFGTNRTFALNKNMELDLEVIQAFLEKHKESDILLFGFTSIVWEHFYMGLKKSGIKLQLKNGVLIHGGGWKKLIDKAVTNKKYKECLNDICGIQKVHNYYGMIEQTGSVFFECSEGYFHTSNFSDVIMRNDDLNSTHKGLIQLISLIPTSYPGHSILSEDYGEIFGEDDCACGRNGKYFKVYGRIKQAEIRGCSDTITK